MAALLSRNKTSDHATRQKLALRWRKGVYAP